MLGGYLALIQLVLMSRSPWLEQVVGQDALTAAHRWVGFTCVWFIVAHVVLTTTGFALADGSNVIDELWTLLTTYEFMLMAGVSLVLFVGVAISSVKLARRHLSYETWHGIHFYAYLAIALGLGHQLVTGSDFSHDPIAWTYWVGLYVIAASDDPGLPLPAAPGDVAAPPVSSGQRHPGGPRGDLDLPGRPGPRSVCDPGGPVRDRPVPRLGRLVARPSVLDLGGAEWPLAAPDGQGPG